MNCPYLYLLVTIAVQVKIHFILLRVGGLERSVPSPEWFERITAYRSVDENVDCILCSQPSGRAESETGEQEVTVCCGVYSRAEAAIGSGVIKPQTSCATAMPGRSNAHR